MLGCPKDTVAYIDVTGNPQFCNIEMPNYMQCPMGYSCSETTNNKNVCCTIESGNRFITSIYKNLTTTTNTTNMSIENVKSIIKPPKEMEKSKITETKQGNNQIEETKEKSQRNKNKERIINKTQKTKEKVKNKTEEQETQEIEEFVDIFEISSKKIQCKPNQIYINGKCV